MGMQLAQLRQLHAVAQKRNFIFMTSNIFSWENYQQIKSDI